MIDQAAEVDRIAAKIVLLLAKEFERREIPSETWDEMIPLILARLVVTGEETSGFCGKRAPYRLRVVNLLLDSYIKDKL